jgi:hypothetical protein
MMRFEPGVNSLKRPLRIDAAQDGAAHRRLTLEHRIGIEEGGGALQSGRPL